MITVHIEFISDFICPWCYIGNARLIRLREKLAGTIQLEIVPKPYILYPHISKGGLLKEHFAKRTKPGMGRSLKYEAARESLEIKYKNIERIPYSLEAHQLMALIPDNTVKNKLAKRIFINYFENGQDIESHNFLIEEAKKLGVNKEILGRFEFTDEGLETCQAFIKQAKDDFINIVPSLRLDHQFLIPGLQEIDVWEKYIRRAAEIQLQKNDK